MFLPVLIVSGPLSCKGSDSVRLCDKLSGKQAHSLAGIRIPVCSFPKTETRGIQFLGGHCFNNLIAKERETQVSLDYFCSCQHDYNKPYVSSFMCLPSSYFLS